MTDTTIPVQNPATTDSNLDAEGLTVSSVAVKRERMQVTGAAAAEIARVINALPVGTEYALVTRDLPLLADGSYLASAARTTTQTQGDQVNPGHKGIAVILDMTVVGTGSVTLEIDGKDPVSGKYVPLLTGAAVVTNSTNTYTIYPGGPVTANVAANASLWKTWRIKVTANNANTATYSVGFVLLP